MNRQPAPADLLLEWYDRHRRDLPWRAKPGETADPYRVWLSEAMLQQTTVATVIPYYRKFLERWPDVTRLAQAPLDEVLTAWAGLGYYARARNLHACARDLVSKYRGRFPMDSQLLAKLPGIGPYTAAAVAAIAFDERAIVVDGNVERVVARYFALTDPLPGAKAKIRELAARLTPHRRPGDYAQAAMDLGATICTPAKPACGLCPWRDPCEGRRQGIAADLPARAPKKERPTRHGFVFWLERSDGKVLLRRRPEKGLLGGMIEFPGTPWRDSAWSEKESLALAPLPLRWKKIPAGVRHSFTHFHLELDILAARSDAADSLAGLWAAPGEFSDLALPSLMKKVARLALGDRKS